MWARGEEKKRRNIFLSASCRSRRTEHGQPTGVGPRLRRGRTGDAAATPEFLWVSSEHIAPPCNAKDTEAPRTQMRIRCRCRRAHDRGMVRRDAWHVYGALRSNVVVAPLERRTRAPLERAALAPLARRSGASSPRWRRPRAAALSACCRAVRARRSRAAWAPLCRRSPRDGSDLSRGRSSRRTRQPLCRPALCCC